MKLQELIVLGLQLSIALTVFGFGLKATVDDVLDVMRRPALLARSLVAMFLIMPVVAVILGPLAEENYRRAMQISQGDWVSLFTRPVSGTIFAIAALAFLLPVAIKWWRRRTAPPEPPINGAPANA